MNKSDKLLCVGKLFFFFPKTFSCLNVTKYDFIIFLISRIVKELVCVFMLFYFRPPLLTFKIKHFIRHW